MNQQELQEVLERHRKWLDGEEDGKRADLCGADLYGADLYGAYLSRVDLRGADLCGADLSGADLRGADLHGANLRRADLRRADLCGADLSGANLRRADLRRADLCGADLRGADLRGADLEDIDAARLSIAPECGSFIGWKRCGESIVKLLIPSDAKRSNATGRKCRCSKAWTLGITDSDGRNIARAKSDRGGLYEVGKLTVPDSFDEDRWNECSHGIHFFITREEAVAYR